jgi:TRAP-type uncharacterized transport system fused permease subunit
LTATPEPVAVPDDPQVSEDAIRKAEQYIEEDEGAVSRYRGWLERLTSALLVVMSLFHLYAAVGIVPAQVLRPVHVGFMLLLVFLLFPVALSQPPDAMGLRAGDARRRYDRLPACGWR